MLISLSFVRLIVDVEATRHNAPDYLASSELLTANVIALNVALSETSADCG